MQPTFALSNLYSIASDNQVKQGWKRHRKLNSALGCAQATSIQRQREHYPGVFYLKAQSGSPLENLFQNTRALVFKQSISQGKRLQQKESQDQKKKQTKTKSQTPKSGLFPPSFKILFARQENVTKEGLHSGKLCFVLFFFLPHLGFFKL